MIIDLSGIQFITERVNLAFAGFYLTIALGLIAQGIKPWFNKTSTIRKDYSDDLDKVAATIEADHCAPILLRLLFESCSKCGGVSDEETLRKKFAETTGTLRFREAFNEIYVELLRKEELTAYYEYMRKLSKRLFGFHVAFTVIAFAMFFISFLVPTDYVFWPTVIMVPFLVVPGVFYGVSVRNYLDRKGKLENGVDEILKRFSGISTKRISRR